MDIDELRDFAHFLLGARQNQAIYPPQHPQVGAAVRDLHLRVTELLADCREIRIGLVESELILGDRPVPMEGDLLQGLARLLASRGVGRLVLRHGLRRWELAALVELLASAREELEAGGGIAAQLERREVRHVSCGHLNLSGQQEQQFDGASLPEVWELYTDGLGAMRRLKSRLQDGVDPEALGEALEVAAGLVEAVENNAEACVLVHSLKSHDDYSYTHSLDVALLSLALARQLQLPESILMELTMAALTHDLGKALVPAEVLNKPGRLTPEEWEVMQRHSADGARMLLRSRSASDLAVVVAYEHQLAYERDNPDYGRWPLHLVSELVCVADVYDALRSNRPYRDALPPDEALRVMEQEAESKFDPDLFACFRSMMGYYPPGTCLRLSDGSLAISRAADTSDAARPEVLVVRNADGGEVEPPVELILTETPEIEVAAVVDGDPLGIEPLDYL